MDEGNRKLEALGFRLVITQALSTLFGEVGAAMAVDILAVDDQKQEAVLRVASECAAPACRGLAWQTGSHVVPGASRSFGAH